MYVDYDLDYDVDDDCCSEAGVESGWGGYLGSSNGALDEVVKVGGSCGEADVIEVAASLFFGELPACTAATFPFAPRFETAVAVSPLAPSSLIYTTSLASLLSSSTRPSCEAAS